MCSDAETEKLALKDAIQRAVNFYEAHVSELNTLDAAVGLQVVQGLCIMCEYHSEFVEL